MVMSEEFISGFVIGFFLFYILQAIVSWWRSRYTVIKKKELQEYAKTDVDLTLKTLYPVESEGSELPDKE